MTPPDDNSANAKTDNHLQRLVIVSGLSGSGKSVALHSLEDLDYYCIDNLPAGLLTSFVQRATVHKESYRHVAVGIDARNLSEDLHNFPSIINSLRSSGVHCDIFFLTADNDILVRRFSETRRSHPLASNSLSLLQAISHERSVLEPVSNHADLFINTSYTNIHQLKQLIWKRISLQSKTMSLLFLSFAYKKGVPSDADLVFDARCLPNPHWDPQLRPFTGLDSAVGEFLGEQPLVNRMFDDISRFLETWIPQFEAENRRYMTIAIGCTGGQHRSVYLSQRLADAFMQTKEGILIQHRELAT